MPRLPPCLLSKTEKGAAEGNNLLRAAEAICAVAKISIELVGQASRGVVGCVGARKGFVIGA